MLNFNQNPWWNELDSYTDDSLLGEMILPEHAGPHGIALVQLYARGNTQSGWGQEQFMRNYGRGSFSIRKVLYSVKKELCAGYAWVMRSLRVVCIDIDGKNGGIEHASELGLLPPTTAETSKSGNGYHLFYLVDCDTWDTDNGFALISDHIGIVQGVDIRGTGCVYHYSSQRWNGLPLAKLPDHLLQRLQAKSLQRRLVLDTIRKTLQLDPGEIAIMHDQLLTELAQPIAKGKRNITLFAIGSQMKEAQVPKWGELLYERAVELGLDHPEAQKLVDNVSKYSD